MKTIVIRNHYYTISIVSLIIRIGVDSKPPRLALNAVPTMRKKKQLFTLEQKQGLNILMIIT